MSFKEYWNKVFRNYNQNNASDDWISKYFYLISGKRVLDLGCGTGYDTEILILNGYDVLSCDQSETALEYVAKNIANSKTLQLDIENRLPFDDDTFDCIVVDLSLHYFSEKATKQIISEIRRVLKTDGVLLARVNSTEDINHGAMSGKKIEENYFFTEGYNKRFFDENEIEKYFSVFKELKYQKTTMLRYSKPKIVYEICCIN